MPVVEKKNKTSPKKIKKTEKEEVGHGLIVSSINPAIAMIVLLFSVSYIVTNTFTFGYKVPSIGKYLKWSDRIFTLDELKQYNGVDETKPIYLAINGKVYDVTAGRSYYGPEGGYKNLAGRDAARAYVTGCFETHLTHDLRGLNENQLESLKHWVDFYDKSEKYFYVGKIIHDPIPDSVAIPEECK